MSGVRTSDWLDLSKCEDVLKAVYDFSSLPRSLGDNATDAE